MLCNKEKPKISWHSNEHGQPHFNALLSNISRF